MLTPVVIEAVIKVAIVLGGLLGGAAYLVLAERRVAA